MGYWSSSSSPYDVQSRNGKRFDFAMIQSHYENVKPLRGKRKEENIRPIGQRDRHWERMIKVSDTEYYVTFDCYRYRTSHNKAITWSLNNDMETMIIHTPKQVWNNANQLHPRTLSSSSVFWFYDFNMPQEFSMVNYRANKYVRYNNQYYIIEKGDITFQRKVGQTEWQPLVVHREFKHTLDRKQTKHLRKMIEPFLSYYDVMCDIVEAKNSWGNAIFRAMNDGDELRTVDPDEVLELFKHDGEIPNAWLLMVEYYKERIMESSYDWKTQTRTDTFRRDKLHGYVAKDLFQIARPCKTEEVPLGKLSNDRYKGWYL